MPWEYWRQLSFPEIGDNWLEYTDHAHTAVFCISDLYVLRISLGAAQAPREAGLPKGGNHLRLKTAQIQSIPLPGRASKATLKPCIPSAV